MASAGYDETDKTVADGVAYLQKNQSKSTYEEGLVICALQRLAGDKYRRKAQNYFPHYFLHTRSFRSLPTNH